MSEKVFDTYLKSIDPQKNILQSDYREFKKFSKSLDDQWIDYNIDFFNLIYERLMQRMYEVELLIPSILDETFEFESDEEINVDFENLNYSKNKKKELRWRATQIFNARFYDIKIKDQEKD